MNAIILSIGSELMIGQTVDTNTAWLAARLAEVGVPVLLHIAVADELEPIRREADRACELADLVLITGGLGPTEDDLTRQALAAMTGNRLELRPEFLDQIRAFFTARGRPMPQANEIQAMFPAGSEPIANTCGTAPGIHLRHKRADVFAMPGVPREMQVMFDRAVLPFASQRAGGAVILARNLWCFGAGESDIGLRIRDLMQRGRNPAVGTTAQQMVIGVRIHARGQSRAEAEALLVQTERDIRDRLGTLIFGADEETLAEAVGKLLIRQHKTISTAESCTAGLLAKRLTDLSGSSAYFISGVATYADASKVRLLHVPEQLLSEHGAVSREVAEAMAVNCRADSNTDFAISITGIAGPTGGTPDKPVGLVYIGLADRQGCKVTEHRLGETLARDEIRDRACKIALNRLRLRLLQ